MLAATRIGPLLLRFSRPARPAADDMCSQLFVRSDRVTRGSGGCCTDECCARTARVSAMPSSRSGMRMPTAWCTPIVTLRPADYFAHKQSLSCPSTTTRRERESLLYLDALEMTA